MGEQMVYCKKLGNTGLLWWDKEIGQNDEI